VNQAAVHVLSELVAQRWSTERDLSDTVESLAVETVLASAEAGGRGDHVEDELFRFERIVAGNPALRDALVNRNVDPQGKAELVGRLLQGKVTAETARLARQSVLAPRGRKFDRTLELYLALAAKRREQLTAVVIAAVPLDETQRHRLAAALQGIYGKPVQLQLVIDEKVVGGIRVQIGDEVVDGTILRKLEGARRHFAG
jgi:F-type H+-transporting ATPase subunit delta